MKHRSRVRYLLSLSTLLLALPAVAQDTGVPPAPAREQLQRFSSGLETLHARFEQQVVDAEGSLQDQSSGEVWLRRPQQFRWEYGGEFPERVIGDGERIWIYDVVLEQVTVKNQSEAADSALTLLTDPDRLDEQFEVRDAGNAAGAQLLELRSRNRETEFDRILLGFRDDSLELMILEDAFGLRTELGFSAVERNPQLDDALFRFKPPAGVDVIGDLPAVGEP